jgi:long-chain acyl-CoA synthetase
VTQDALATHICQRWRDQENIALEVGQTAMSGRDLVHQIDSLAGYLASLENNRTLGLCLKNSVAFVLAFLAGVRANYRVAVFDPTWPKPVFEQALEQVQPFDVWDSLPKNATSTELPQENPENNFYIGFTSGSTGVAKAFQRTQNSWLASFRLDQQEFEFSESDVFFVPGQFSHSLFLYALLRGLYAGARVVCAQTFRPDFIPCDTTVFYGVPTHILQTATVCKTPVSTVRLILSSGAAFPKHMLEGVGQTFPRAEFCETYGASELGYVSLWRARENPPVASVGRPFNGVTVSIKNAVIQIESDLCFSGYLNGQAFEGINDTGYLDEDGFLFLTGRADRMIISKGKNIHPEQIETVLRNHPAIEECAVVAQSDDVRGESLIAFLLLNTSVEHRDLVAFLKHHLPRTHVPQAFYQVDNWPRLPSGKTDFKGLQAMPSSQKRPL